jgi:hypothetical protein
VGGSVEGRRLQEGCVDALAHAHPRVRHPSHMIQESVRNLQLGIVYLFNIPWHTPTKTYAVAFAQ